MENKGSFLKTVVAGATAGYFFYQLFTGKKPITAVKKTVNKPVDVVNKVYQRMTKKEHDKNNKLITWKWE